MSRIIDDSDAPLTASPLQQIRPWPLTMDMLLGTEQENAADSRYILPLYNAAFDDFNTQEPSATARAGDQHDELQPWEIYEAEALREMHEFAAAADLQGFVTADTLYRDGLREVLSGDAFRPGGSMFDGGQSLPVRAGNGVSITTRAHDLLNQRTGERVSNRRRVVANSDDEDPVVLPPVSLGFGPTGEGSTPLPIRAKAQSKKVDAASSEVAILTCAGAGCNTEFCHRGLFRPRRADDCSKAIFYTSDSPPDSQKVTHFDMPTQHSDCACRHVGLGCKICGNKLGLYVAVSCGDNTASSMYSAEMHPFRYFPNSVKTRQRESDSSIGDKLIWRDIPTQAIDFANGFIGDPVNFVFGLINPIWLPDRIVPKLAAKRRVPAFDPAEDVSPEEREHSARRAAVARGETANPPYARPGRRPRGSADNIGTSLNARTPPTDPWQTHLEGDAIGIESLIRKDMFGLLGGVGWTGAKKRMGRKYQAER